MGKYKYVRAPRKGAARWSELWSKKHRSPDEQKEYDDLGALMIERSDLMTKAAISALTAVEAARLEELSALLVLSSPTKFVEQGRRLSDLEQRLQGLDVLRTEIETHLERTRDEHQP